jgi:ABC-type sugar transport system substrate-binding protein
MASALYAEGLIGFIDNSFNWATTTVKALLVKSGFVFDPDADKFLDPGIPAGERATYTGGDPTVAGRTVVKDTAAAPNGEVELRTSGDTTFTAVTNGQLCVGVILYADIGGLDTTRRIIGYAEITTPGGGINANGSDIQIQWTQEAGQRICSKISY